MVGRNNMLYDVHLLKDPNTLACHMYQLHVCKAKVCTSMLLLSCYNLP